MNRKIMKLEKYKKACDIFDIFHGEKHAVFLDSSLENSMGNYSIIGMNSYLNLTVIEGILYVNGEKSELQFEDYLKDYLQINKDINETGLPIISGAIGYLSYDYGRKNENINTRHNVNEGIPECIFNFYDNFIVDDIKNKETYIIANGIIKDAHKSAEEIENRIISYTDNIEKYDDGRYNIDIDFNFNKQEYKNAIDRMIQYIIEGDIYIANMTQQLKIFSKRPPYSTFKKLRKNNPSPFGGYFNYDAFKIISASPERFLRMKDSLINTRPIKGTRPRGRSLEEDNMMKHELENSEKDKSELLMIVDLERNDLNKVCEKGSVAVEELFTVEEYATVFHLVSDIKGKLKKDLNVVDLIQSAFPGGSITGAPKIRAMEIIDELENGSRGIYTGSFGYLSLDGNCDLNIIIRTALYKDNNYYLGVGGGITCESDLEFEYEETLQKAKALIEAIN